MFQLPDINLTQIILIQVGVFFQMIAVGAYLYESGARRQMMKHMDALERAEHEEHKSEFIEQAKTNRTKRVRGEGFDEPAEDKIRTRGLTRTSKVQFRQTFNFRRHGT